MTLAIVIASILPELAPAQNTGWDCLLADSTSEANTNTLRAITLHAGRFVAVGDSGTVMLSTNGTQWFRQPTPAQSALYGVTTSEDQFVAVGDGGCVLLSTNGSEWTFAARTLTNNLRAVAFGNGVYVVLTDRYKLLVSSNASVWQPSTNGIAAGPFLYGLYFGGGRFVAYGSNGAIVTSADGLNWNAAQIPVGTIFTCGAYGGGVFVVAGHEDFLTHQVAWSTDGLSWTPVSISSPNSGPWYGLCYGTGQFVGVDSGQIICSADGQNWGACGGGFPAARLWVYGLGHYVALAGAAIYTSTNLSDWTQASAPVCPIQLLAQGNGVYVGASGDCGMIYSSEDGVHFIQRRVCGGFLTSLTFAKGIFLAAGSMGILLSTDGTNWTTVSLPCTDPIWTMQYANGMWMAACSNIISSVDGTNWTVLLANAGHLSSLIYGGNRWVGCGWNGLIWSSADAMNWQNCSYGTPANLGPISFQDGLFSIYSAMTYLVPESALVSRDGLHWFDATTSGPLLAVRQGMLPGTLALSLAGKWNAIYSLQGSVDLHQWSEVRQINNSAGVTSVAITNLAPERSVFYRATPR